MRTVHLCCYFSTLIVCGCATFSLNSRRQSEGRLSQTWAFIRWLVQVIEMPWFKCLAWLLRFEVEGEKSGLERWANPEGSRSRRASVRDLIWVFALIMKRHAAGTLEWWFIIHLKEYGLIAFNSCSLWRSDCVFPVIIQIIFFLHIHPGGRSFCSSWLKLNRLWSFTALGKLCLFFCFKE